MKLRYMMMLVGALSLSQLSPSFGMEDNNHETGYSQFKSKFNVKEYVKSFVPKDSSEEYIKNVELVVQHVMWSKEEINHGGKVGVFNLVGAEDYGWNFPSMPRIQNELLQFCAQANSELKIADVGAGFGFDSLLALLTKKARVFAFEKLKAQCESLQLTVEQSILKNVDKTFPINKFTAKHQDILEFNTLPLLKDFFDGMNVNKLIHFFDPQQTETFKEKIDFFVKPGGRLFLTCLTPTPGTKIETFMNSEDQKKEQYPGYLFYRLESELIGMTFGESQLLEVRKPTNEKSAFFKQEYKKRKNKEFAITHRVMHYHTSETLTNLLGKDFKILKTFIIPPEENMGTDHMISIVAEKL